MAGLISPNLLGEAIAAPKTHIIHMDSDEDGAKVWFDPIGLFIRPGDSVRWIIKNNVHTVTSYHPDNENHALRIPHEAKSWNSDYLVEPGDNFEITLDVPGVYDYYCEPHEEAGMVGRIVVGEISGPGALPYDYFETLKPAPDWQAVPVEARKMFPDARVIMDRKVVRLGD